MLSALNTEYNILIHLLHTVLKLHMKVVHVLEVQFNNPKPFNFIIFCQMTNLFSYFIIIFSSKALSLKLATIFSFYKNTLCLTIYLHTVLGCSVFT